MTFFVRQALSSTNYANVCECVCVCECVNCKQHFLWQLSTMSGYRATTAEQLRSSSSSRDCTELLKRLRHRLFWQRCAQCGWLFINARWRRSRCSRRELHYIALGFGSLSLPLSLSTERECSQRSRARSLSLLDSSFICIVCLCVCESLCV